MKYSLELRPEVKDDFKRLDKSVAVRILKKLQWLSEQGEQITHQSLSANLAGFYKLRVGDYRVIYKLELETSHEVEDNSEPKNENQSKGEAEAPKAETVLVAKPDLANKVVVYFVGHRRDIYKRLE